MNKKIFLLAAFDSLWNWVVGGIMLVISIITFFLPNLQPFLNWPTLSHFLPPVGWLALAIIIWLVGFAWNIRKRLKKKTNGALSETEKGIVKSMGQQGGMTGIVSGDLYQGGIHYHDEKKTNKENSPEAFSVSYLKNNKGSFKEEQKRAIEKISELINVAVENSIYFSQGISRQGEPSINEQCKNAYDSGKAVMEYIKNGNNRLYFSATTRKNITELYELISVCVHNMDIARRGNFDLKLWNEYSEKLQKIKILKDEIDSDFHEFLVNFDKG